LSTLVKSLFDRSVALTAASGFFAQLLRPASSLLIVPLIMNRFGIEGFGVWVVVLSFMGVLGFYNNGIGEIIIYRISAIDVERDRERARDEIADIVVFTVLVASILLLVVSPVIYVVNWADILNVEDPVLARDANRSIFYLFLLVNFGYLSNIPRFVMIGMQKGYLYHSIEAIYLLAGLAAIFVATFFSFSLSQTACLFIGAQLLVLTVLGFAFLARAGLLSLRVSITGASFRYYFANSYKMSLFQLSNSLSSDSDSFLISMVLGPEAVSAYAVAQRLFALPNIAVTMINQAVWPRLNNLKAAYAMDKVIRAIGIAFLFTAVMLSGYILLLTFNYDTILNFWIGEVEEMPGKDWNLLIGMSLYLYVFTAVRYMESIIKSTGDFVFIMRASILYMIVKISLAFFLLQTYGVAGAIFGTVLGLATCKILLYTVFVNRMRSSAAPPPAA